MRSPKPYELQMLVRDSKNIKKFAEAFKYCRSMQKLTKDC